MEQDYSLLDQREMKKVDERIERIKEWVKSSLGHIDYRVHWDSFGKGFSQRLPHAAHHLDSEFTSTVEALLEIARDDIGKKAVARISTVVLENAPRTDDDPSKHDAEMSLRGSELHVRASYSHYRRTNTGLRTLGYYVNRIEKLL